MKSLLILSALAAASTLAGAAGAGAQEKTSKPDSTCTKYSDGRIECRVIRRGYIDSAFRRASYRMDSVLANRAALGLEVRTTGSKRDTLGVFVEAVTPKGPAENAGIVEGDRIASINGVDLRTSSADADDEYASGVGPRRLTREVQKLTPGTRITLRVYSGGRVRDVQVTTGKASDVMRLGRSNFRFQGGGMEMYGPDRMMFGPEMRMIGPEMPRLREHLEPLLRDQIEPMLRERLRDLPERIQLRTLPRVRAMRISPRTYRADRGYEDRRASSDPGFISIHPDPDDIIFDSDDMADFEDLPDLEDLPDFENFRSPELYDDMLDIEEDLEPVSPDVIRELAETAARDARDALKQLSEAGVV